MGPRISTAAVIRRDRRLYLVKRPPGGDLGDCWELPGGKCDTGESPEQALHRELEEELGIDAEVHQAVGRSAFEHNGRRFELIAFRVTADVDSAELCEHVCARWFSREEALALEDLAPSDRSLLELLRE